MTAATAVRQPLSDTQARERILLAAERMFARHGYGGTSLRSIMAEAGVNTASVHYYFGGKEALLRAVFGMRVGATNAEREALLDECERAAGRKPPSLRALLEAFFGPAIRMAGSPEDSDFNQITALCSVDPDPAVRRVVFESYDALAQRFLQLLRRACPDLDENTLYWKLNCLYGSMMYVRTSNGRVAHLIGKPEPLQDTATVLDELVTFVEGGFLARKRRKATRARLKRGEPEEKPDGEMAIHKRLARSRQRLPRMDAA